jgi:hypothetical protein
VAHPARHLAKASLQQQPGSAQGRLESLVLRPVLGSSRKQQLLWVGLQQ